MKQIIDQLSLRINGPISQKNLIIFDEIQLCPKALTSLKYFAEDGNYDVMTAGSHLGLELTQESFPVGKVDFLTLYPMSFSEFLQETTAQFDLNIYFHKNRSFLDF